LGFAHNVPPRRFIFDSFRGQLGQRSATGPFSTGLSVMGAASMRGTIAFGLAWSAEEFASGLDGFILSMDLHAHHSRLGMIPIIPVSFFISATIVSEHRGFPLHTGWGPDDILSLQHYFGFCMGALFLLLCPIFSLLRVVSPLHFDSVATTQLLDLRVCFASFRRFREEGQRATKELWGVVNLIHV
jgi:hypothetical protein